MNIPLHAAIVASAPPSAKEPTRPITIEALYLLWKRKPVQAPDIDAPKTLSSATIVNSDSAKTLLKSKLSIKLATSTVFFTFQYKMN
jgi:hypothetical protein